MNILKHQDYFIKVFKLQIVHSFFVCTSTYSAPLLHVPPLSDFVFFVYYFNYILLHNYKRNYSYTKKFCQQKFKKFTSFLSPTLKILKKQITHVDIPKKDFHKLYLVTPIQTIMTSRKENSDGQIIQMTSGGVYLKY